VNASQGWLLALDPGVNAGVAAFLNGKLVRADVISAPKERDKHRPDLGATDEHARSIVEWWCRLFVMTPGAPALRFASEWPKLYQGDRGRNKDLNDYLGLTALDGAVASKVPAVESCVVYPAEWKGQLKAETNEQMQVIIDRLRVRLDRPGELAAADELGPEAKGKNHNGWDAVGIGLHVLGRGLANDRVRRFPR